MNDKRRASRPKVPAAPTLDSGRWPIIEHPTPDGPLRVAALAVTERGDLAGFNSADHRLLEALDVSPSQTVVVLGDRSGALGTALRRRGVEPTIVADSASQRRRIALTMEANGLSPTSRSEPTGEPIDVLVAHLGRSVRRIEEQLVGLGPAITQSTKVLCGARVEDVHHSVVTMLNRALGPTEVSEAARRARLVSVTPSDSRASVEGGAFVVAGHAGTAPLSVFGADAVDPATSLLLATMDRWPVGPQCCVDYGCGAGAIGMAAMANGVGGRWIGLDDDYAAVETTASNWAQFDTPSRVVAGYSLDAAGLDVPVDLVVMNPPYHVERTSTRLLPAALMADAAAHLGADGSLVVVGPRHLRFDQLARRYFRRVTPISAHDRFVVLHATGPRGRAAS